MGLNQQAGGSKTRLKGTALMWRPGFSCLFRICRAAADFLKQRGAAGTAGVTQSDAEEGSVSSAPLLPTPGIRARRDGVFAKRIGDSAGSLSAGSGLFCVRIPAQRVPVLPLGAATAAAGGLRASRSRRLGCCGSTRRGERKKQRCCIITCCWQNAAGSYGL